MPFVTFKEWLLRLERHQVAANVDTVNKRLASEGEAETHGD